MRLFLLGLSLLVLPSCGSETGQEPKTDTTGPAAKGSQTESPRAGAATASENAVGEPNAAPTANGFSSVYTALDLDGCMVLEEERVEGSSARYRCQGYNDVPIFVQEGDLRFDIDAGVANNRFETTGPYNSVMDTLEWRMKDGAPIAVIFRYSVHNEIGPQPTTLAIESIGKAGVPGCRVAHIAGSFPNANRRAREIADSSAASFACSKSEPQVVGDATVSSLGG